VKSVGLLPWPKDIIWVGVVNRWRWLYAKCSSSCQNSS